MAHFCFLFFLHLFFRSSTTAVVFDHVMCSLSLLLIVAVLLMYSFPLSMLLNLQITQLLAFSHFFAEKNLSYHISSFNESTGFGLLKASPVEFVKYPFVQVDLIMISPSMQ